MQANAEFKKSLGAEADNFNFHDVNAPKEPASVNTIYNVLVLVGYSLTLKRMAALVFDDQPTTETQLSEGLICVPAVPPDLLNVFQHYAQTDPQHALIATAEAQHAGMKNELGHFGSGGKLVCHHVMEHEATCKTIHHFDNNAEFSQRLKEKQHEH